MKDGELPWKHESYCHWEAMAPFPLAKVELARGVRAGLGRGEDMGIDRRFLIFTGSPQHLLQKEEFEVSSPSMWSKVGSLPAFTIRWARFFPGWGRLWGSHGLLWGNSQSPPSTYLGKQPEDPSKPLPRHHHNGDRESLPPTHLCHVSKGQNFQVTVQGAAVEHLVVPAKDRELKGQVAPPQTFQPSQVGKRKFLHSMLRNLDLILPLIVKHGRLCISFFPLFLSI